VLFDELTFDTQIFGDAVEAPATERVTESPVASPPARETTIRGGLEETLLNPVPRSKSKDFVVPLDTPEHSTVLAFVTALNEDVCPSIIELNKLLAVA
jgi:hypothetical protein